MTFKTFHIVLLKIWSAFSNYCLWLPDWEPCGENENVKKYADDIDGETEKDTVLVVRMDDAPDEGEKKDKIVDHDCLTGPFS